MPRKSNKKNQNKSYSIFKHVMIGVITTILLLTVVKAVSTAWHAAEEIRMTIDGVETNLQNAAETGQLAKLRTFGEKKTLQKAWDDGDFITDFPDGMVTTRTGSGYYKCEAERCIATCLGNKIFLKLNEGKYCGRQTWSDWSDYNDNDGYDKIRIKVLFGVNGWNVNNCQFCSVGSDSYSMAASDQKYGWSYCVPELGGCAPYSYFGDWDRVSRPMQKEVNFKCESINAIGQSDCNPQQRPLANGIRMYTPALDLGLTAADWSAAELSFPAPPIPIISKRVIVNPSNMFTYCSEDEVAVSCVVNEIGTPCLLTKDFKGYCANSYAQLSVVCIKLVQP